jgi:hypothetical protein
MFKVDTDIKILSIPIHVVAEVPLVSIKQGKNNRLEHGSLPVAVISGKNENALAEIPVKRLYAPEVFKGNMVYDHFLLLFLGL